MINSFLASLHNSATPPVNPSSVHGDVLWPSPLQVQTFSGDAGVAEEILFGAQYDNLARFLLSIQLLWVVEESVCADTIQADDSRITYTREQLVGQFVDQTGYEQHVSAVLAQLPSIPAHGFLTGRLLEVYRSALSPLDRLAAVIAYFGMRHD